MSAGARLNSILAGEISARGHLLRARGQVEQRARAGRLGRPGRVRDLHGRRPHHAPVALLPRAPVPCLRRGACQGRAALPNLPGTGGAIRTRLLLRHICARHTHTTIRPDRLITKGLGVAAAGPAELANRLLIKKSGWALD